MAEKILSYLRTDKIGFVINTTSSMKRISTDDEYAMRRTGVEFLIPVITRIETAKALIDAIAQNGHDSMI